MSQGGGAGDSPASIAAASAQTPRIHDTPRGVRDVRITLACLPARRGAQCPARGVKFNNFTRFVILVV